MTLKQLSVLAFFPFAFAGLPAAADNAPAPVEVARENGWVPQAGDEIRFKVLRRGSSFGTHTVRFESTENGGLVARSEVSLRAGLGPITVFRYELTASETWEDGQLVEVTGEANDDGTRASVTARRNGEALVVEGTAFEGEAPEGAVPASHWNYDLTRATHLLSTEDGEILEINVVSKGRETISAGGQEIEANRYLLESNLNVDLWYDDDGRWVKLAFEARGHDIEYVLDSLF